MTAPAYPVAATDMSALRSWGLVQRIGSWTLDAACRVRRGGGDSIWIDLGHPAVHGASDYQAVWREACPHTPIPAGYAVQPLLSLEDARRAGVRFVRLDLVPGHSPAGDGKGYVLTSVQHSASDTSGR